MLLVKKGPQMKKENDVFNYAIGNNIPVNEDFKEFLINLKNTLDIEYKGQLSFFGELEYELSNTELNWYTSQSILNKYAKNFQALRIETISSHILDRMLMVLNNIFIHTAYTRRREVSSNCELYSIVVLLDVRYVQCLNNKYFKQLLFKFNTLNIKEYSYIIDMILKHYLNIENVYQVKKSLVDKDLKYYDYLNFDLLVYFKKLYGVNYMVYILERYDIVTAEHFYLHYFTKEDFHNVLSPTKHKCKSYIKIYGIFSFIKNVLF